MTTDGNQKNSESIMQKLIYLVAGAHPNFMKIAPIVSALNLNHGAKHGQRPALWDGVAAQRIVAHLGECLA